MRQREDSSGPALIAAALAAAVYAGFRFNECVGTDLVLSREPPGAALGWLQVLNSKRTPGVLVMIALSLGAGLTAVRLAWPRRLAAVGLGVLLVEDTLTVLHIRLALLLQSTEAGAVPPGWESLCARYVFDDVARTALLVLAAIAFAVAAGQPARRSAKGNLEEGS